MEPFLIVECNVVGQAAPRVPDGLVVAHSRVGSGFPVARRTRHPPSEPDVYLSAYPALPLHPLASPVRQLTGMAQVMTFHAENHGLSLHGHHHPLPSFFAIFHIGKLAHMMDFLIPTLATTVLTCHGIQPLDDFGTAVDVHGGTWQSVNEALGARWVLQVLACENFQVSRSTTGFVWVHEIGPFAEPACDVPNR